jgi:hypothetical protein
MLLKERQHTVIGQIGGRDQRLAIVELGEGDLGVADPHVIFVRVVELEGQPGWLENPALQYRGSTANALSSHAVLVVVDLAQSPINDKSDRRMPR